jgi:hypothetical protein
MNKIKTVCSYSLLALVGVSFLMTGCVARRIAWSPDGAHAAIFAGDGLHLCGPDGALSEVMLPGDGMGEWFPDSRRLAVISEVKNLSWQDLQKLLPPQNCQYIEQSAKTVVNELKAGRNLDDALDALKGFEDSEKAAVSVFLAQSEGIKEVAGTNWDELREKKASLIQLRVGQLEVGKLSFGPPLASSLLGIMDVRVSPDGAAVAFTVYRRRESDSADLYVTAADGSVPPLLVSSNTAYCADWSANGRSLVYVRAINPATHGDELCLGSLTRTTVLNAAGKFEIGPKSDDLAGLLFDVDNKVRRLSNGRIVFAAADVCLPCTSANMPQQPQLFAIDPELQTTVIPLIPLNVLARLPDGSAYYEPSPDGKRIAIYGAQCAVVVLTLATGDFETIQPASSHNLVSAPAWRSADELCFVSTPKDKPAEVSLRVNGTNIVLSASWPAEARKDFLDH